MATNNLPQVKATILTSGIQKSNPGLYQALNQMVDMLNTLSSTSVNVSTLDGNSLPLQDPHVKGRLWNNAGVVTVSNG